jgi:hypothetical protein
LLLHLLLIELQRFDLLRQLFQSLVNDCQGLGDVWLGLPRQERGERGDGKHAAGAAQGDDESENISWFHGGNLARIIREV